MRAHGTSEGLRARDVRVTLAGRCVLDGAGVSVPRAQVTALVAPSGAGKSTLLRALVRLVATDRGSITLDGEDVHAIDPRDLRRRVGLVAQMPVMLPGSVADNLRHGVDDLGDDELHAALDAASLDAASAVRVARELSGGERARVALARALTRRPEVLLLDEPTAALDAAAARRIGESLRGLRDRGLAICVATHDAGFVAAWADRSEGLP
ncbi:MAG TPA: ATP-binding cassette domain-containing protein [Solirubrobacteraceae bacterium]|jgi:ABC-type multidrug transport system fused ATPase/permease subunit